MNDSRVLFHCGLACWLASRAVLVTMLPCLLLYLVCLAMQLLMKEHDVLAARLHLEAAARDAATEQEMAAVHAQVPRLIDLQMNLRAC